MNHFDFTEFSKVRYENFANLAILLLEHKFYSTLHLIIKDVCI